MNSEPTRVTLTDEQLAEITDTIGDAPVTGIALAWSYIHPDWNNAESVDPSAWQIPEWQWHHIANALGGHSDHLTGTNYMLDWVNIGPGGFDDS